MITIVIRHHHIFSFLTIIAVLSSFFAVNDASATLSCSVSTTCNSPSVVVLRMSSTTNAHSELPSQSNPNYSQLVCCSAFSGLSNQCTNTYAIVVRLSSTTNAHAEQNTVGLYPENACLSVPAGGTMTVAYQDNNCTGYDATVLSMSSSSNAHVGDGNAYTRKVCASASQTGMTFIVDSNTATLNAAAGSFAATTTLMSMVTTNPSGFFITVQKSSSPTLILQTDSSISLPDKTEYIAPAATTSAANTTASTTQPSTLQFRIQQTGTDTGNYSSSWWGTDDTVANALFGGFPSTTQQIINRSVASAATTTATALYYLGVPTNQQSGIYSGTIVYTATVNP